MITLKQLSEQIKGTLHGDPDCKITGIAPLDKASSGDLTFLSDPKFKKHLSSTKASVVILAQDMLEHCPVNAIVVDNPYLAYARATFLVFPARTYAPGIDASASVHKNCKIDPTAHIGPQVTIEEGVIIGAGACIGAGCVIEHGVNVGKDTRLVANVTICHGTVIGERCLIHPGAVIGSDGFGLANDKGKWIKMAQLGCVRIGDDVEIGSNTTIDRGALEDTVLENGVKLDNLIQVAHNCHIGENTAIAGCVGIAGSTKIGKRCTIAGSVGLAGHLELGDDVHITGMSLVTKSIMEPGVYSSGPPPAEPQKIWRRNIVRYRQLDDMANRLSALEKQLKQTDK